MEEQDLGSVRIRRLGVGLLLAAIAVLAASELKAQDPVSCETFAVPLPVGATGTIAVVGDIVITCVRSEEAAPPGNRLAANVRVSLNAAIANAGARLIVNENDCAMPAPVGGAFGACGAPDSRWQDPQLGRVIGGELVWSEVDLPLPGAPDPASNSTFPSVTTIRITGVQADVGSLDPGVPVAAEIRVQLAGGADGFRAVANVGQTQPTAVKSVPMPQARVGAVAADAHLEPSETGLITCRSAAAPVAVNESGRAETLGDIVLVCSNRLPPGGATTESFAADFSVQLNAPIVGRGGFGVEAEVAEAELIVNGNECGPPSASGGEITCSDVQNPQYGRLTPDGRLVWQNVRFPVPSAGSLPAETTIVIRGIAADATKLGVFPSQQGYAFLTVSQGRIPVSNSVLAVGAPMSAKLSSSITTKAGAGTTSCSAIAVPPISRAEGVAERQGDVVITCTNVAPPGGLTVSELTLDLSVSLNVNATNNVDFGPGATLTDAVLVVNENNCASPAASGGVFGGCGAPDSRFQDPQLGVLAAVNRLEFQNVQIPIPGADPDGDGPIEAYPATTTLRVVAIRANPSQLGVPDTATFPSTQVTAFLSFTGGSPLPITSNVLNVSVPILGALGDANQLSGLRCFDGSARPTVETLEGFATSLKVQGSATVFPGSNPEEESGYPVPGSNNGGGASQGTRVLLRFFNVPSGVALQAPQRVDNGSSAQDGDGLELLLVTGANANGAGGSPTGGQGTAPITLIGGFGFAVYEVVDSDPFNTERIEIPLQFSWAADQPDLGSAQVTVNLAPLTTVITASGPDPEPRFVDPLGDPETILSLVACPTAADKKLEIADSSAPPTGPFPTTEQKRAEILDSTAPPSVPIPNREEKRLEVVQ